MTLQTCESFCNSQKQCFAFDFGMGTPIPTPADPEILCTTYKEKTTISYGSKADNDKICYWKSPQDTDTSTN